MTIIKKKYSWIIIKKKTNNRSWRWTFFHSGEFCHLLACDWSFLIKKYFDLIGLFLKAGHKNLGREGNWVRFSTFYLFTPVDKNADKCNYSFYWKFREENRSRDPLWMWGDDEDNLLRYQNRQMMIRLIKFK